MEKKKRIFYEKEHSRGKGKNAERKETTKERERLGQRKKKKNEKRLCWLLKMSERRPRQRMNDCSILRGNTTLNGKLYIAVNG